MAAPLWEPTPETTKRAHLTAFLETVNRRHRNVGVAPLASVPELYQWSIDHPEAFWGEVWRFAGVVASRASDTVVEDFDKMPGAKWFPGARLNFAENLLRYGDDGEALVAWNERGRQRSLSYAQLADDAARMAAALKNAGVTPGDRVAGYMPNIPETVAAMLASASLGAVWSSCSPDFGQKGVLDRFGQIEPKVLIAADGYFYNGKTFDTLPRLVQISEQIPSVERVVVVPYAQAEPPLAGIRQAQLYNEFLAPPGSARPEFEQLPFDHPLCIMYSSGTTGKPKCIVHGAGGTLLQHLKEHILHADLHRQDRIFYFTTCGWMMWNWLVSALATGATVVLYDGAAFMPHKNHLFDMAEQERISVFGTSAKFISAAEKAGVNPASIHDLGNLRTILSTGSPLAPESFDYIYSHVKKDVCLSSISGGTDILSCFALGNPIGPVYRGELQMRGLGMRVEVYSEDGRPSPAGEKGELVCTQPFPSMPVGFWNDPGGEQYHTTYFDKFPGVWRHGDYCELTEHDGMIIWGRSDAVLNPGGVRIGTAEIYRVVEQVPEVLEAVAVGQSWQDDVRVILFLRLRDGVLLDAPLINSIRQEIRQHASPRHVPAKIIQVGDIPRTRNGKIAEIAVRNVIEKQPVQNREALANPEALRLFDNLPQLQS
ncbi:MAG TPA: acetoacetate--CoA ligase [Burkholderiales bacterium]|nr:acetoacetate--CoA ligase [Burkholderiales bacterium]